MATTGGRLIPVELLRRSCRRKNPEASALTLSGASLVKKEFEPAPDDGPIHEPAKKRKLKVAHKLEVKQEPTIKSDVDVSSEHKCPEAHPEPDGFLEADRDELDLERTLMGGQSFRWRMTAATCHTMPTIFTGVVSNHVMQLWRRDDHRIAFKRLNRDPTPTPSESIEQFLNDYFQLKYKLKDLYEHWSQRDEHFKRSCVSYRGFRILRQDPVENVFSFICATNNNIKRISLMIDKMCQHFGDRLEIVGAPYAATDPSATFHSFPAVDRLARDDVFDLLRYKLGFGYRAKFICETAKRLVALGVESQQQPRELLLHLRQLDYRETCKRLQEFPGIGRKVADCICLMSMDHLESVPIDCHIYEIVCRDYLRSLRQERKTLTEAVHDLIGQYFTGLHGPLAGWATSVLFIGELKHLKQEATAGGVKPTAGGKKASSKKRGEK